MTNTPKTPSLMDMAEDAVAARPEAIFLEAARTGDRDVLELLMDHDVYLDDNDIQFSHGVLIFEDTYGLALSQAIFNDHFECATLLLTRGSKRIPEDAAQKSYTRLINKDLNPNTDDFKARNTLKLLLDTQKDFLTLPQYHFGRALLASDNPAEMVKNVDRYMQWHQNKINATELRRQKAKNTGPQKLTTTKPKTQDEKQTAEDYQAEKSARRAKGYLRPVK